MAKDDKVAAHGKTRGDFKDLHNKQSTGQELPMVAANGADAPAGFKIRKDEADLVHVQLEIPNYNSSTGAKLSEPMDQKFTVREFKQTKESGGFAGYTTKILHFPGAEKAEVGTGAEGARKVDSNYAAMQDAYESLTGERPEIDWTEHQLDVALKVARKYADNQKNSTGLVSTKPDETLSNTPGLAVGRPAGDAVLEDVLEAQNNGSQSDASALDVAKAAGNNTAPTGDGTTSVGQQTVAPVGVKVAVEDAESETQNGRRGARPAGKPKPTAAEKAAKDEAKQAAEAAKKQAEGTETADSGAARE